MISITSHPLATQQALYTRQEDAPALTQLHIELEVWNDEDLHNLPLDSMPQFIASPNNPTFRGGGGQRAPFSNSSTSNTKEQAGHTSSSGGTPSVGLASMGSLLEALVDKKVQPLSSRVTALETDVTDLKTKLTTFNVQVDAFGKNLNDIDEHVFQTLEKRLSRINRGIGQLDVTNIEIISQGTILRGMMDDLMVKYMGQVNLDSELRIFTVELRDWAEERMSALEGDVHELEQGDCERKIELENQAAKIKQLYDECNETVSAGGLEGVLRDDMDLQGDGTLMEGLHNLFFCSFCLILV